MEIDARGWGERIAVALTTDSYDARSTKAGINAV